MSSMEDRREKNESSSRISDMMLGAFATGNLVPAAAVKQEV